MAVRRMRHTDDDGAPLLFFLQVGAFRCSAGEWLVSASDWDPARVQKFFSTQRSASCFFFPNALLRVRGALYMLCCR